MSINRELWETVAAVFAQHAGDAGKGLPSQLWSTLTDLGLVQLSLPASAGGSGGELSDVATLLLAAGEAAAAVPLAEAETAGWLLHAAGLPVPDGPLALAVDRTGTLDVRVTSQRAHVSGALSTVGWARCAARVVLLASDQNAVQEVLSIQVDPSSVRCGANVAGEPRDDLVLDADTSEIAIAPTGAAELVGLRAALYRALLLAGAAGAALTQAVHYAPQRVQFGRPIAKFQAIQQELALAAGEVAASRAAADTAVRIVTETGFASQEAEFAVAVAKARTSEAAGVVARIAHQVLGAIGFTLEHDLRLFTTRLWAWRDEDGDEAHWNAVIARRVLVGGSDELWPVLTRSG